MEERPIRSVVKAFSWRVTGTVIIILTSLVITGKIDMALSIGVLDFGIKLVVYFLHERAWNKIKFGKVPKKSPEYYI